METGEHHLSVTGMRGRLRQCRIEAASGSDAAVPRSDIVGSSVWLQKQLSAQRMEQNPAHKPTKSAPRTNIPSATKSRQTAETRKSGFTGRLTPVLVLSVTVARPTLTEEQLSGAHLSSAPALLHRR